MERNGKTERLNVRETAIQVAAEGAVLLKNEAMLPLKPGERTALFGCPQIAYIRGGSGSGRVITDKLCNFAEGLRESGIALDEELYEAYQNWIDAQGGAAQSEAYGERPASVPEMPLDRLLLERVRQRCSTAVVVIGRCSNENTDHRIETGDWYLSDAETMGAAGNTYGYGEKEMLRDICSVFGKVAVILNIGAPVDLGWMEDFPQVRALLVAWQLGNRCYWADTWRSGVSIRASD